MARRFLIYRFNVGQNRPRRKERNPARKTAGSGTIPVSGWFPSNLSGCGARGSGQECVAAILLTDKYGCRMLEHLFDFLDHGRRVVAVDETMVER